MFHRIRRVSRSSFSIRNRIPIVPFVFPYRSPRLPSTSTSSRFSRFSSFSNWWRRTRRIPRRFHRFPRFPFSFPRCMKLPSWAFHWPVRAFRCTWRRICSSGRSDRAFSRSRSPPSALIASSDRRISTARSLLIRSAQPCDSFISHLPSPSKPSPATPRSILRTEKPGKPGKRWKRSRGRRRKSGLRRFPRGKSRF